MLQNLPVVNTDASPFGALPGPAKAKFSNPTLELFKVNETETDHTPFAQNFFQLDLAKIRDSNGPGLARGDEFFHGFPGLDKWDCFGNHLSIWPKGQELVASLKSAGVMHKVEIDVVDVEITQRSVQCWLDIVRVMSVTPKFCRDKDVTARNATALDTKANRIFRYRN